MPIEIGTLLNSRYKLVKEIGHGGTADVFLATDIVKKRDVAIKLLRDDLTEDSVVLQNFKKEVTIMSCLTSQYIVKVHGYYFFENRPYIVSEFVNGKTLKDLLDDRGMLSQGEAIDYTIQLSQALMAAHGKGIVHRDVKPLNIFILKDGLLKLADFGIADVETIQTNAKPNSVVGSVHYIAPEIALGKPATEASDIYSCGVVLYEMLTGQVPYDKDSQVDTALAHVKEPFPSISRYIPGISKSIEAVIDKCVKKDPKERYASAKEFYADLCRVKNGEEIVVKKPGFFARLFGAK